MKNLKYYLSESELLNEKLITFNKTAYPKYGNVVILAGGSGSGKGFVIKNLLGLEGMTFDVDALKKISIKSELINKRVKDETGYDLNKINLKNPSDVSLIHDILHNHINLTNRYEVSKFTSILTADETRKPNLIFDTTLSKVGKLSEITRSLDRLGYNKENIHIVWVINDYKTALLQNDNRARTVPVEVLMDAHKGASNTMRDIMDMGDGLGKFMNGDIWFVFNNIVSIQSNTTGGKFVEDAHLVKVKSSGENIKNLEKSVMDKIRGLVPTNKNWE